MISQDLIGFSPEGSFRPRHLLLLSELGLSKNTRHFFSSQTLSQFAFENDPFLSLKYLVFVTDQAISKIHYLPLETIAAVPILYNNGLKSGKKSSILEFFKIP